LEVDKIGQYTYLFIDSAITCNVINNVEIIGASLRTRELATLNIDGDLIINDNTNLFGATSSDSYINISGNWINHNISGYPWAYGFYPGQSTVTFEGDGDNFVYCDYGLQDFYNLNIDKTLNVFYPIADIDVMNDLTITNGTWGMDYSGYNFTFYGDITIEATGLFDDNTCNVTIAGTEDQQFINNNGSPTEFNNLNIDMGIVAGENLPVFLIIGDLHCAGNIVVDTGIFFINSNTVECEGNFLINDFGKVSAPNLSTIAMGAGSMINVEGELQMYGDGTNNPKVTAITGNYEFNIMNSGLLSTAQAIYEYMNIEGVNIYDNGLVYGTNALSNCIFRNGESGGTLLQINNDQDLVINGAEFPTNTWGGSYNVAKYQDQGSISFTNETGDFAGAGDEYDPYNRIDWASSVAGIWTGAVNHSWNTVGNWQNDLKPTASDDVYIPAGTPNDPWVATTDQECNNLTIETGAILRVYDEILTVHGDMIIYGELRMDNAAGVLNVGDWFGEIISWEAGSTDIINSGTINVFGDWYFKNGTDAQLGTGNTVNFYGTNRSYIYCDDDDAEFGNLEINKTGVPKDFVHVPSGNSVRVAEDFNVYSGTFELNPGSSLNVGNELNIQNGGTLSAIGTAFDIIVISGDPSYGIFEVASGGTISTEYTYFEYFEGAGVFVASGATVDPAHPFDHCIFQHGTVGGSLLTINNNQVLTIDKVIFPPDGWNNNNRVAKTLNQGHITFTSAMGGYVGDNYENDPFDLIEWPGVVAGIWNGQDNQDWDNEANWDYYLKPTTNDDVTIPTGCTHDPKVHLADQDCNSIIVEAGTTLEIFDQTLTVGDGLAIYGELIMNHSSGVLNVGDFNGDYFIWESGSSSDVTAGTINVYGDWYFNNGTDAQFGGANTVVFFGSNNSVIYCDDADASFCSIIINKSADPKDNVTIPDNNIVRVAEDFYIGDGIFNIGEASIFEVGNELYVDNGGTLSAIGTASNKAVVTGTTNYCLLEIASGGTISAEYTEFKFLESQGLVVNPGATIDPLHPLNYCSFEESPVGGALIHISNNQTLTIDGAIFPPNIWGGAYNVAKTFDQGQVTFTNVEGTFVGEDFENDPYNRIDWPGVVAGLWTGVESPIWNDPDNWSYSLKPDAGDDVYIPAGTPNDPWVSSSDQECNNIIIETGASLRIYDEILTVHGDMIINGHLRMDHAAGVLNAGSTFGDKISWENGSSETIVNGTINVYGDWYFKSGTNAQLGSGNTVNFYGSNNSTIFCNESDAEFGNVTINKYAFPKNIVSLSSGDSVQIAEDLYIGDGELKLNEGSGLFVGNEFYVDNGGTLTSIGLPSQEVKISGYPNHCVFEIASGGTIGAEYTIFEFLEYYGVVVNPGATVNLTYSFNNCIFRESTPFGSLLTINNYQDLTIDGAHFEPNTWNGDYNVRKTSDQGHLTFVNTTGNFAGEFHEYDSYDRIDWYRPWYDVNLKVFLEGPFSTINMETNLSNVIPLSQPFNSPPWNYNGTESVLEIPYKTVDWVLVELRDASEVASAGSGTVVSRRAGFLKNNGYILDLQGPESLQFNDFINDELYVVIWHRNHLGVISAYSLIQSGSAYNYDFTISEDQAFGENDGHKEIAPGIWGMVGGNGNPDEIVDLGDYNLWKVEAGKTGYKMEDFNLDKQVNNKDKNDVWFENRGFECWVPY
ncbi:MAG: hypothetical protein K8R86_09080, partial [Bacteroidales bacterium]|nr:hypothetical protein [Bacteroidales bacterium]